MLYDPKWEQPKPDIFALDTLIEWLEQQPDVPYRFGSPHYCLLAQYFKAMTGVNMVVTRNYVYPDDGLLNFTMLPDGWDALARGSYFWPNHTFGGALKRARRLRTRAVVGNTLSRIPQLLGLT